MKSQSGKKNLIKQMRDQKKSIQLQNGLITNQVNNGSFTEMVRVLDTSRTVIKKELMVQNIIRHNSFDSRIEQCEDFSTLL